MKQNKTILRLKDKVSTELYHRLTTQRVLFLYLDKKWYDMISSGEKKEEYRDITDYWARRFAIKIQERKWDYKKFDLIIFQNGYGDVPTTVCEWDGIEVKKGNTNWGAIIGRNYFTLLLGKILYSGR